MDKFQKRVKEFAQLAGQATPDKPTLDIPDKDRLLRCSLILEEAFEFCRDCGVSIDFSDSSDSTDFLYSSDIQFKELFLYINGNKPDLVKIVDAVGDIKFVADGAAVRYGVDMEEIDTHIAKANMSKFGEGGFEDENGKWNKPPNWEGPEKSIKGELFNQGYEG